MKHLSILALALALVSCGSGGGKITANISGSVDPSLSDQYAYLSDYNTQDRERIDSVLVVDGKFAFSTKMAQPSILRVDIARKYANIIVENSNPITVEIDRQTIVSDNGGSNDIYREATKEIDSKIEPIQQILEELVEQCGLTYEEAIEREQPFKKGVAIYGEQIAKNSDNLAGVMLLWSAAFMCKEFSDLEALLESIPASKEFVPVAKLYTSFLNAEATKEGSAFVDFEGETLAGEATKLSDYVGQGSYVLVDFWASWCGPCMREVPNLLSAYDRFNGESFKIVGVNVWDQREKFEEAVEAEGMEWAQIFISGNTATELYGISGIPQIMLFAPDGTILKRDLRGAEIATQIEIALKK